mmetsp:Transcript_10647/g.32197  ORF Transcript_10647/g.32197 Transcript_10647/m.32197 type:complete len:544 (-) Transcript_10647:338-1969(-)
MGKTGISRLRQRRRRRRRRRGGCVWRYGQRRRREPAQRRAADDAGAAAERRRRAARARAGAGAQRGGHQRVHVPAGHRRERSAHDGGRYTGGVRPAHELRVPEPRPPHRGAAQEEGARGAAGIIAPARNPKPKPEGFYVVDLTLTLTRKQGRRGDAAAALAPAPPEPAAGPAPQCAGRRGHPRQALRERPQGAGEGREARGEGGAGARGGGERQEDLAHLGDARARPRGQGAERRLRRAAAEPAAQAGDAAAIAGRAAAEAPPRDGERGAGGGRRRRVAGLRRGGPQGPGKAAEPRQDHGGRGPGARGRRARVAAVLHQAHAQGAAPLPLGAARAGDVAAGAVGARLQGRRRGQQAQGAGAHLQAEGQPPLRDHRGLPRALHRRGHRRRALRRGRALLGAPERPRRRRGEARHGRVHLQARHGDGEVQEAHQGAVPQRARLRRRRARLAPCRRRPGGRGGLPGAPRRRGRDPRAQPHQSQQWDQGGGRCRGVVGRSLRRRCRRRARTDPRGGGPARDGRRGRRDLFLRTDGGGNGAPRVRDRS